MIFNTKYQKKTDEELMACVQRGSVSAMTELYERYNQRLLQFFLRMFGANKEKAQDFLQDIFIRIIEKSNLFCNGKKFSNWIFTIAYNMCKNEYRYQEVRKNTDVIDDCHNITDYSDDYEYQIGKKIDNQIIEKILRKELNLMSMAHRSSFILKFQENLTVKEISEILNCAEGTVKSRIFYTTQKLANRLKSYNPYKDEV